MAPHFSSSSIYTLQVIQNTFAVCVCMFYSVCLVSSSVFFFFDVSARRFFFCILALSLFISAVRSTFVVVVVVCWCRRRRVVFLMIEPAVFIECFFCVCFSKKTTVLFDFSLFLCLFLYQFLWLIIRIDWQSSTTLIDISEIGFCFFCFPRVKKKQTNKTKRNCPVFCV